jgi:hypothetical protein
MLQSVSFIYSRIKRTGIVIVTFTYLALWSQFHVDTDIINLVQVTVEYESVHYVSEEWEARMVERFCKFSVNGARGRGVSEFHYRHRAGRPETAAASDPEWYRKMCHKI